MVQTDQSKVELQRFVARENLARYVRQLQTCADADERSRLEGLIKDALFVLDGGDASACVST